LFTLCTLLNVIICCSQLNTQGVLGRFSASGFLVIDAVGLRSMYFVVMPRVNLHSNLHDICTLALLYQLPNCNLFTQHVLFILWRDTAGELWTLVQFPLCYTILLLLTLFYFLASYYPFTTRYAQSFVYSKSVRLTIVPSICSFMADNTTFAV
jgi:hypothetical protein